MAEGIGVDLVPPDREPEGPSIGITWSSETRVLGDFDNESGLPAVCRFEEDQNKGTLSRGLKIYAGQPVLLHTRCRKRQVRARTIYHDASGPYYEVGQTLLIPDDFEGTVYCLYRDDFYFHIEISMKSLFDLADQLCKRNCRRHTTE